MAVSLRNVWLRLGGDYVLRDVSAEFRGKSLVVGPNGSGKTVLLLTIAGAYRPERGVVELSGRYSIVFQNPELHFLAGTVEENALLWSKGRASEDEVRKLAMELGIADLLKRSPWELSWGQRKLAAALTALSSYPDILLADELMEGLSPKLAARVLNVVESHVPTIVMTSHNPLKGWVHYFMDSGVLYTDRDAVLERLKLHGYLATVCEESS